MNTELHLHDESLRILDRAFAHWRPSWIFALYSGGNDSTISTHFAWEWAKARGLTHKLKVIAADTGVSADGWLDYVGRVARSQHWLFEVWDNPDPDFYYKNAWEYGMPYTKQMHWQIMYRNLKERAFDRLRAAHKAGRRDRCMMVTGMRRDESVQRASTPEWLEDGAGLWVSPLVNWSGKQVRELRIALNIEPNPFYEKGLGSGDCQCNWGQFIDMERLEQVSPELARRIRPVHDHCLRVHGYGYGDRPTDSLLAERAGQMTLPGVEPLVNLCASCERADPLVQALKTR